MSKPDDITPSGSDQPNPSGDKPEPKPDTVSYESYAKLLGEKKKAQEKLEAFEKQKKLEAEEKLRQSQEHQKLLEIREKELAERNAELAALRDAENKRKRLSAVLSHINGKVDDDYLVLVPADSVPINPETGEVDVLAAQRIAKEFETKHGRLITRGKGVPPKNPAPNGSAGSNLTIEEWYRLPLAEQKARMREVLPKKA